MSHNVDTFSGSSADRQSAVSAVFSGLNQIRIGQGESDNYSNSGASTLTNTTLYFYDSSPLNEISGATLTGASGWYSSVTLPAGRYIIECGFDVKFTASGQFAFQIYNGSSLIGSRAQIGDSLQFSTESAPGLASACINISTSTTFSVLSPTGNTNLDTITNQGTSISERAFITITGIS
jgi:hypothetical protein